MFAKHLPPSPGLPRVWALDDNAAAELPAEIELWHPSAEGGGQGGDAIVGYTPPAEGDFARWLGHLRPGGRLILALSAAHPAEPEAVLDALQAAGYIHCLVEVHADLTLYRGERPPLGSSVERVQSLSTVQAARIPEAEHKGIIPNPFVFLLIHQTPNKPAWTLAPGEKIEWRAATVIDPATHRPVLLAFSSLVKAVAFMQKAVVAKWLSGVNKMGKFHVEVARTWPLPYALNLEFDAVRGLALGPRLEVDPRAAITGEE
jgi:hypothetical protein